MFDTVTGLPVHSLVVHATVVLVPLMALLTVVVALRERLRERYALWVAGGDAVLIPLVYVTKLSGEALQRRLGGGVAIEHGRLGSSLIWFALGLFAAALLVVATRRRPGAPTLVANALAVLAAGAMVVWTVRVGDSGARAVWGGLVSNG